MVLDTFIPTFNIQVGLSLAAIAWTFCITKGTVNDGESRYIIPFVPSSSNCHVTLHVLPESIDGSSVTVTMATEYNETFYETSEHNVSYATNFQIDLNLTIFTENLNKVSLLTCEGCSSMQIAQSNEDPFYLFQTTANDNDYVLLLDDIISAKAYVYIYGLCKNTTVNIGLDEDGNGAITNVLQSYSLDSYDRIFLEQNNTIDGLRIRSSDPINVLISNYPLVDFVSNSINCNHSESRTWELVPATGFMGTEFIIYAPSKYDILIIKVLGLQNGSFTWYSSEDFGVVEINALYAVVLNFTGSQIITISSSIPIQVLCITWSNGQDSLPKKNTFFVFPIVRYSNCMSFTVTNCQNNVCAIALSKSPVGIAKLSSKYGEIDISGSRVNTTYKTYFFWEIQNLTDGVYFLELYDSLESLVMFKTNLMSRLYPLMPISNSSCHKSLSSNHSSSISGAISTPNVSPTVSTNFSRSETNLSFIGYQSYSNDSSSNDTSIKQLTDRERFPFMYAELPEDDREVNEYMVAVIVSLCTAIFAVVAVISIFLLKELVTKRRQIGNSKIRPFVS